MQRLGIKEGLGTHTVGNVYLQTGAGQRDHHLSTNALSQILL